MKTVTARTSESFEFKVNASDDEIRSELVHQTTVAIISLIRDRARNGDVLFPIVIRLEYEKDGWDQRIIARVVEE